MAEQQEDDRRVRGRPWKLLNPVELRLAIQNYFDTCNPHLTTKIKETGYNEHNKTIWIEREHMTEQKPYTISGLAKALGCSRTTLFYYRNPDHLPDDLDPQTKQDLLNTIDDAFSTVEEFAEGKLFTPYSNGAKFNLVNNFSWVDKKTSDDTGKTLSEELDELDDIADQAEAHLEDADAGSETPE